MFSKSCAAIPIRLSPGPRLVLAFLPFLAVGCTTAAPTAVSPSASTPLSMASPEPVTRVASPAARPATPPASPSPSPSPSPIPEATVRLGIGPISAGLWPILVAARKGLFQNQSIRLQLTQALPDGTLLDELAASRLEVAALPAEAVVERMEQGAGITIVAGLLGKPVYHLIVGRETSGFSDLRGKRIGVTDPRAASTGLLAKQLAARGLGKNDYTLVALGSTARLAAAIANGSVAAGLIDYPRAAQMMGQRFQSLGLTPTADQEYPVDVVAVRGEWGRREPDALVRFLKALVEAERWLYLASNKQEAASLLADASQVSLREARESYEAVVEWGAALASSGEVSRPGISNLLENMIDLGRLKRPAAVPERYLDTSFLDRAKR